MIKHPGAATGRLPSIYRLGVDFRECPNNEKLSILSF